MENRFMKLAGHTMGTPEYTLFEAIDLFAGMGLDGIEIIVQTDGYPCGIALEAGEEEIDALARRAKEKGLLIAGLTPYLNLFNSLDEGERQEECRRLKQVIHMAERLGTENIRVYGGHFVEGEQDESGEKRRQLIRSMRECGDYARAHGNVRLNLENHFGTMTSTAAQTAEIVKEINHPNVGVLYDQANIAFFPAEEYEEAIEIQREYIYYVHCKDLVYREDGPKKAVFNQVSHVDPSERTVYSRIPGQGILNWPAILEKLQDIGYDGWISLEYERRWIQTDLPEAGEGMPKAAAYIRSILKKLDRDREIERKGA